MTKAFAPHGDTRIDVRGRILVLRPQGHLNAEEVGRILRQLDEIIPSLGGKPWAVLYVLQDSTLLTPDAENSATGASSLLTAAGLSTLAIVLPPGLSGRLQEAQVRSIYADTHCAIRVFDDEPAAFAWASSMIGE